MEISVSEDGEWIPFSHMTLAKAILRSGLEPLVSYRIAEEVKEELIRAKVAKVSSDEIFERARLKVRAVDPSYERKFVRWVQIGRCDTPFFILIGGAPGVGTSSVSAELAYRLGSLRVVGTDSIREILRKTISPEFLPMLHASPLEPSQEPNPTAWGDDAGGLLCYRAQSQAVCVGVGALLSRGIWEGTSTIIEGTHLLPSFLTKYLNDRNVFYFMLKLEDEKIHLGRLYLRERQSGRAAKNLVDHFSTLKRIQDYMVEDALKNGVEVIEQTGIMKTVDFISDYVMERMVEVLECENRPGGRGK